VGKKLAEIWRLKLGLAQRSSQLGSTISPKSTTSVNWLIIKVIRKTLPVVTAKYMVILKRKGREL
jgi:hypothetical protein